MLRGTVVLKCVRWIHQLTHVNLEKDISLGHWDVLVLKLSADQSDQLNAVPGSHIVEGKNRLQQAVQASTYTLLHVLT